MIIFFTCVIVDHITPTLYYQLTIYFLTDRQQVVSFPNRNFIVMVKVDNEMKGQPWWVALTHEKADGQTTTTMMLTHICISQQSYQAVCCQANKVELFSNSVLRLFLIYFCKVSAPFPVLHLARKSKRPHRNESLQNKRGIYLSLYPRWLSI